MPRVRVDRRDAVTPNRAFDEPDRSLPTARLREPSPLPLRHRAGLRQATLRYPEQATSFPAPIRQTSIQAYAPLHRWRRCALPRNPPSRTVRRGARGAIRARAESDRPPRIWIRRDLSQRGIRPQPRPAWAGVSPRAPSVSEPGRLCPATPPAAIPPLRFEVAYRPAIARFRWHPAPWI